MFDIGWSELVVIGVVALIAIGPKELPGVLRMVGQWMGKARKLAAEFQGHFNEAMREAEMADLKKTFDDVKDAAQEATRGIGSDNIMTSLRKDVTEAIKLDQLDAPVTPTTPEPPTPQTFVEAEAHAAETSVAGAPLMIAPAANDAPTPDVAAQDQAVRDLKAS